MHPTDADVTRRRFLSGLAVLGFTPLASRLDGFSLLDTLGQSERPRRGSSRHAQWGGSDSS